MPAAFFGFQFIGYLFFVSFIFHQVLLPNFNISELVANILAVVLFFIFCAINGKYIDETEYQTERNDPLVEDTSAEWLKLQAQDPMMVRALGILKANRGLIRKFEELYRLERELIGAGPVIVLNEQVKKMNSTGYSENNHQYNRLLMEISKAVAESEENIDEYSQWISYHLGDIIQLFYKR